MIKIDWKKLERIANKNRDDKDCLVLNKSFDACEADEIPEFVAIISEKRVYPI